MGEPTQEELKQASVIDELDEEEARSMGYVADGEKEKTEPVVEEVEDKPKEKEVPVVEEKAKPNTSEIADTLSDRVAQEEEFDEVAMVKKEVSLEMKVENMEIERELEKISLDMSAEEINIIAKEMKAQVIDGTLDKLLKVYSVKDAVKNMLVTAEGRNRETLAETRNKLSKANSEAEKKLKEISSFKQKTGEGTSISKEDALFKDIMSGDRDAMTEMLKQDDAF